MIQMKRLLLAPFLFLVAATTAVAGDPPASAQACAACHGQKGVSNNPEWPNLAGQKAGYLADQMRAFRDGVRENPAMAPVIAGLTDEAIAELSAFYAAQPAPSSATGDPALVERGEHLSAYCKACHGMSGQTINEEWPNLAGQHAPYLKKQLQMFKSGERINPSMQAVIARLGDGEFAALAAYYSSLKP